MIYTLTLNPTLDKTIDVEEFIYDDVNRILQEKRSAQGKGIDVSRVIKELGGQSVALGFAGGYNGLEIEGRLAAEGIPLDFTRISGETGTNITIHQQRKKMETLLAAPAARVAEFDISILLARIKQIPRGSHLVITGAVPPGVDEGFYAQVIAAVKDRNVKTFLDADGEAFKSGAQAGPYLMKPNIHEFGRLIEKSVKDERDVVEHAEAFLDLVELVVVSMGMRGALGVSRTERLLAVPPKVEVKSSIGAGDALLAGIVYGLSQGTSFRKALELGVSCGTASTLNAGRGVCKSADVYAILKQVSTKDV